ncbi:MAG: hypothetical protein QXP81_06355 [Nitrososphaerota archaeon]
MATLPDLTDPQTIAQLVLLFVGVLMGYGAARVLKGALLILVGLVVLGILGLAVTGLPAPGELLGQVWDLAGRAANALLQLLRSYPTLGIGLLIGFVIGLIR